MTNIYAEPIVGEIQTVNAADGASINTHSVGEGSPVRAIPRAAVA